MSAFFMVINTYQNYVVLVLAILSVCILYLVAHIPLKYLLKTCKIVLPFIIVISVYDIILKQWNHIAESSTRIFCSIGLANLISLTTSLQDILKEDGSFSRLLNKVGIPVDKLRLAIHIVLRSIPLIINEKDELQSAFQLRGAARNNTKIIFQLLLRTVSQSNSLVDALELRGT